MLALLQAMIPESHKSGHGMAKTGQKGAFCEAAGEGASAASPLPVGTDDCSTADRRRPRHGHRRLSLSGDALARTLNSAQSGEKAQVSGFHNPVWKRRKSHLGCQKTCKILAVRFAAIPKAVRVPYNGSNESWWIAPGERFIRSARVNCVYVCACAYWLQIKRPCGGSAESRTQNSS